MKWIAVLLVACWGCSSQLAHEVDDKARSAGEVDDHDGVLEDGAGKAGGEGLGDAGAEVPADELPGGEEDAGAGDGDSGDALDGTDDQADDEQATPWWAGVWRVTATFRLFPDNAGCISQQGQVWYVAESWTVRYGADEVLVERNGRPDMLAVPGYVYDFTVYEPGEKVAEARWEIMFREDERDMVGRARWWDEAMGCRALFIVHGERLGDLP